MTRILIVEDDEAQRFLYYEELAEEGYEVGLAKNGKEALKCLDESVCDLMVLDIRMPEINGIEVLGKIGGRYKNMPVVLHTAYPEFRNQSTSLMADAFVVKSFDLSLLKATIKRLLEEKTKKGERRWQKNKNTGKKE